MYSEWRDDWYCFYKQGKIGPKGGPGGAGPKGEPVSAYLNTNLTNSWNTQDVDHVWCFEQGIPGRDGKDGTPGLDGQKVNGTILQLSYKKW